MYVYVCMYMWDIWNMKAADESMFYKYDAKATNYGDYFD